MGGSQPPFWLAWMPVHHDLLMMVAMLAALLLFDLWLESGARRFLIGCWIAFALGALSKEYVYIFPLLSAIWGLAQQERTVSRARILRVVALMVAVTIALFAFRWAVLPHPYNPPPLKRVHFIRRPFLYWFAPFYKYVLTEIWWFVAQVAATGATLALWVRALRMPHRKWPTLPTFAAILLSIALPFAVGWAFGITPGETFWYLFEPNTAAMRLTDFASMLFLLWALWLLWKYRRSEPSLATLGLLLVIYLPVFTYLGWHYCLAGGFIRGALWWPVLAKLVWRDSEGWWCARRRFAH